MQIRGLSGGGLLRAFTALIVAVLSSAAALHLFFSDAHPPDYDLPQLSAGALQADLDKGSSETAEPAPPSILIRLTLEHTARVQGYLQRAGLDPGEARHWAELFAAATHANIFLKGHLLNIYRDPETSELRGFKYDLDEKNQFVEVALGDKVVKATQEPIRYFLRPVKLAFATERNFRSAAARNHLPGAIADAIEDAFSPRYDLDRLRAGSWAKVIYEERVSRDGVRHIPGDIEAVEIRDGDQVIDAFALRDAQGRVRLYDGQGRALGPQFLRFPVNFEYVSSGFSYRRYHPILHAYRPHVGVDLVARYGTPVKAVADGEVEASGWCGELGNCIRLGHGNHTATIYGHLARISPKVRPGSSVAMGQVIGWVGSSGLATGPHLHFGLEKRGSYVNPLSEKLGVNHEVSPRMRALFAGLKQRYQLALAKLPDLGRHLAAATPPPASASTQPTAALGSKRSVRAVSQRRHHLRRLRFLRTAHSAASLDLGAGAL